MTFWWAEGVELPLMWVHSRVPDWNSLGTPGCFRKEWQMRTTGAISVLPLPGAPPWVLDRYSEKSGCEEGGFEDINKKRSICGRRAITEAGRILLAHPKSPLAIVVFRSDTVDALVLRNASFRAATGKISVVLWGLAVPSQREDVFARPTRKQEGGGFSAGAGVYRLFPEFFPVPDARSFVEAR